MSSYQLAASQFATGGPNSNYLVCAITTFFKSPVLLRMLDVVGRY